MTVLRPLVFASLLLSSVSNVFALNGFVFTDNSPYGIANRAAGALEAVSRDHGTADLQTKRDKWAKVCELKAVGSQSRAECDQILSGMDEDIEKSKTNKGAYGEIIGHLRGIADAHAP
mmetsp:Transcript_23687/g.35772  ORF Transcript_23687/g.35772 Transcript_23687/m.35772 type:complete len:118 (-) Transcript_23687:58-411(-)|eukprot:CAMPEP_0194761442 /NCGR_PEP_ID=MMETSP0323_2-20130528/14150_1 /TAXON_ID=2866 ORGANISM="Crypthecodinium cohnii, Strain Seligo" /NCGR_SAMPLE_ID=MMETSP0323_2 /ASSEMBLY_ACC=CAM_ASM_000346 /LENGTH=117 /DNA_ID=CAMNT_0039683187 /DNA_START=37 /DNA_END=390 /DNA_ORIENTATION=-